MFDDLKKQSTKSGEPEDMFQETDRVPVVTPPTQPASAPASAPKAQARATTPAGATAPPAPASHQLPERNPMNWKPIIMVFVVLFIVAVGATLAFFLLSDQSDVPETIPADVLPAELLEEDPLDADQEEQVIEQEPEPLPDPDTDKDGLTDTEEVSQGTSPTTPDTDADGLFDYEEVKTYGTNPLNPDSDGDGYLDGEEVKNGYDPAGPGRLLEIPQK